MTWKFFSEHQLSLSYDSVFPISLALTGAVLHYQTGDHGDSRTDSLLSGILIYWALLAAGSFNASASRLRRVILPALGTLFCLPLLAIGLHLFTSPPQVTAPAFLSAAPFANAFPILGILVWWALVTTKAPFWTLFKALLMVAFSVSLWIDVWNFVAWLTGRFLIETTIGGATQLLFWFGDDVSRSADVLRLAGHSAGSIEVLLGCTGLPIFRLLLKIIIVDSVVLGSKRILWYVQAVLASFLIMMLIGPFRVAILTAAAASGNRAFHFWHGDTGIGLFSALGFLAFLLIVGRLKQNDGLPTPGTQGHGTQGD